ncbi:MAG: hypothetical protein K0Q51_649 [Rickettsiaceae bacterium]|jgi:hypothetical protein|nr:hypothetical protein [Rickettsiaceae bacterium]
MKYKINFIALNSKEDIQEQLKKFADPKAFFPEELIKLVNSPERPSYFKTKDIKYDKGQSNNTYSLEEIYDIYCKVKDLKRSNPALYQSCKNDLSELEKNLTEICKYHNLLKNNTEEVKRIDRSKSSTEGNISFGNLEDFTVDNESYLKLDLSKRADLLGDIDTSLLSKDPKLVAKQLLNALASTGNTSSEADLEEFSNRFTKVILEYGTPEQVYKAKLIGQAMEKIKDNPTPGFLSSIQAFTKSLAALFSSKYKVKDENLNKALDDISALSESLEAGADKIPAVVKKAVLTTLTIDKGLEPSPRFPQKEQRNFNKEFLPQAKPIFGDFTGALAKVRLGKTIKQTGRQ